MHKNGDAWSPAIYPAKAPRKKQFVEAVYLLPIDLDHMSEEQRVAAETKLQPYQRIIHASHSDRPPECSLCTCGSEPGALHGQDCPSRVDRCLRAILMLTRPVKGNPEWEHFWPAAMAFLGLPADPSCCDSSRIYFMPSRPQDADYYFAAYDGIPIDVDAILANAPPVAPSVAEHLHLDSAGVVEPGQRHAMLKSMAGAMRFRGAGYEEIEAALLAANKRCSPPKPVSEIQGLAKWAAEQPITTLPRDNTSEPPPPNPPSGGAGGGGEDDDGGDFQRDKNGHPYNSQYNIEVAIRKLKVSLRYNEFANEEIVCNLPNHGPAFDDPASINLRLKIDSIFRFLPARELFRDVTTNLARKNRFHSVRDYLSSLAWDQEPRIERWLIDYAGAPDTPYVRAVSRIVLIAAVRRVREPGVKYDEMVILESGQGSFKSEALRALAGNDDWFTDDLPLGSDTPRFMESTAGKWIIEAGELKGMSRTDVAALKACLSRKSDEARMAYGYKKTRMLRQFVIIGTTNETDGYLRDTTGNRRFWPIRIKCFDLERLRADRDQLWAEASEAEALGESIRLNPDLYEAAAAEQEARLSDDEPLIDLLHRVLGDRTGKLSVADAFMICGIEPGKATQDQRARFGRAIRELGWVRSRRQLNGAPNYAYVKGTADQQKRQLIVEYDMSSREVKIAVEKNMPMEENKNGSPAPAN